MRVGDRVRLITPGNARLDGTLGVIAAIAPWGAHVTVPAAATGRFRAAWDELAPIADLDGGAPLSCVPAPTIRPTDEHVSTDPAPIGDSWDNCDRCGSTRMRQAGVCKVCPDCGESGGCG